MSTETLVAPRFKSQQNVHPDSRRARCAVARARCRAIRRPARSSLRSSSRRRSCRRRSGATRGTRIRAARNPTVAGARAASRGARGGRARARVFDRDVGDHDALPRAAAQRAIMSPSPTSSTAARCGCLRQVLARFGVETTFFDGANPRRSRRGAAAGDEARSRRDAGESDAEAGGHRRGRDDRARAGVPLAVDNTLLTPILQRPFELGADLAVYSTTKYLEGHNATIGGAIPSTSRRSPSGCVSPATRPAASRRRRRPGSRSAA